MRKLLFLLAGLLSSPHIIYSMEGQLASTPLYISIKKEVKLDYCPSNEEACKDNYACDVFEWHKKNLGELDDIDKDINQRPKDQKEAKISKGDSQRRSSNLATFSVTACYGDQKELRADFSTYIFFSRMRSKGISEENLDKITASSKIPYFLEMIENILSSDKPDESPDYQYRINTLEYFGWTPKITRTDSERILNKYEQLEQRSKEKSEPSTVKQKENRKNSAVDLELTEKNRHKKCMRDALLVGGFDERSNSDAKQILGSTADHLFEDFHHCFYHSEQVIRSFIRYITTVDDYRQLDNNYKSEIDIAKSLVNETAYAYHAIKKFQDKTKQVVASKELRNEKIKRIAGDLNSHLIPETIIKEMNNLLNKYQETVNEFQDAEESYIEAILKKPWQLLLPPDEKNFCDLTFLRIDIASHKFPCQVCCGTYWYDVNFRDQLKKAILICLVASSIDRLKFESSLKNHDCFPFLPSYAPKPISEEEGKDSLKVRMKYLTGLKEALLQTKTPSEFNKLEIEILFSSLRMHTDMKEN